MKCYIVDVDGTIADSEHRLHYLTNGHRDWANWSKYWQDDKPIQPVIDIIRLGAYSGDIKIVICTARDKNCGKDTIDWLDMHQVPFDALYMREVGDDRPDSTVKFELLQKILSDGYEPLCVFDDRQSVVDMWRAQGLICLQVAPGDF